MEGGQVNNFLICCVVSFATMDLKPQQPIRVCSKLKANEISKIAKKEMCTLLWRLSSRCCSCITWSHFHSA